MDGESEQQQPDEALALRTRSGDPVAFAALATRHWNAVHRVARNMLSDASDASAVTEETFLAVRSSISFPLEAPFRIFLYRVALSLSLCRLRERLRPAAGSLEVFLPRFDAGGRLQVAGSDWSGLGNALLMRRELEQQLREALELIDDLDRASFVLRHIEGLPAEDAAAILSTSPEAIRERSHRACLMLTGFLGQLFAS